MNKGEDHLGSGVMKRELLLSVAWWVCLVQRGSSLDSTNVYEGGVEE